MVHIEGLESVLESHPFFKDMDAAARKILAGCAKNEVFKPGDYLLREGAHADKFYLIRSGSVAIELHAPGQEPHILESLHEGDVMGWSWLVAPYRWNFDARARDPVRAVSLDAKCLRGKVEKDHSLGYELFKRFIPVMAERIGAARLQMLDLYSHPRQSAERKSASAKKPAKKKAPAKKAAAKKAPAKKAKKSAKRK